MGNFRRENARPTGLRMALPKEHQQIPSAQTRPKAVKAMKGTASLCYRESRVVSNSSKRTIARDDSRSLLTSSIMLSDPILINGGHVSESVCRTRRLPALEFASFPALKILKTHPLAFRCRWPPHHRPFLRCAAILSRIRSPMISRSN